MGSSIPENCKTRACKVALIAPRLSSSTHDLLIKSHQVAFLKADGAHDIHKQLDLSGEPLIPPLRDSFQLREPMSLIEYHNLTVEGRNYEAAYSDYWNATTEDDGKLIKIYNYQLSKENAR